VHFKNAFPGLQRHWLAIFGNLGLEVRRTHALAFHIDSTGTSRHRSATTATETPPSAATLASLASLLPAATIAGPTT
jgi:hypothetical protein